MSTCLLARLSIGLGAALLLQTSAVSASVLCHVSYGGETQQMRAVPTRDPYAVATMAVGSYFLFRMVFEHPSRAFPGIKIYT